MKKAVFRAEASVTKGYGHMMRCISVSDMLREQFSCSFAIHHQNDALLSLLEKNQLEYTILTTMQDTGFAKNAELVVCDGYWYDNTYIKDLKDNGSRVVQIEDFVKQEYFADIVINHAVGCDYTGSQFHGGELLSGNQYAMLRKEFFAFTGQRHIGGRGVAISMGGSDPQNYTQQFLKRLSEAKFEETISVILGPSYEHDVQHLELSYPGIKIFRSLNAEELIKVLLQNQLLICPASTMAYEALALGLPLACAVTASNQLNMYDGLLKAGVIYGLGVLELDGLDELAGLAKNLNSFTRNYDPHNFVDGKSGERIMEQINRLWN